MLQALAELLGVHRQVTGVDEDAVIWIPFSLEDFQAR